MELIQQLFPENILQALGWTVLHSLWQAFIVALVLAAYLLGTKGQDARKRYLAGCSAMGAAFFFSVLTFFILLKNSEVPGGITPVAGAAGGQAAVSQINNSFFPYFNKNMPLIVALWLLGMAVFLLKMLGGLLYIQQLKSRHLSAVPAQWQQRLVQLKEGLGISKTIQLAASAKVKVPIALGWLKPVVLLPLAAVNNLDMQQVEAILAHELAHIARHDYLVNILQSIIEALFYFNPAIWWMSARIRSERENCCDDVAVALCGSSLAYAKALVSLQEMQQASPALAMSFSKDKNKLLLRIQRILQSPAKKTNIMEKISATVLLLAAVLLMSMQMQPTLKNANENTISETGFPFAKRDTVPLVPKDLRTKDVSIKVTKKDGEVIDYQMKNGEIESVKVNGKTIPKSRQEDYDLENISPDDIETVNVMKKPSRNFPQGNYQYNRNDNGNSMKVKIKDGKITYLKINGEEVPESEYPAHEQMLEEMLVDIPAPPTPPAPPFFDAPAPPSPPAPPSGFFAPPVPPAPPAPPAPPKKTRTITSERHGNTTSVIIESTDGEAPIEIEFKNGKKGNVTINGKEIKGMKNGDRTVIVEEMESPAPKHYFYDGANGRTFWFPNNPEITDIPFPELHGFVETPNVFELQELAKEGRFPLPDYEDLKNDFFYSPVPQKEMEAAKRELKKKQRELLRNLRELERSKSRLRGDRRILQNDSEAKSLLKKMETEHRELLAQAEKAASLSNQLLLDKNKVWQESEELKRQQKYLEQLTSRMERLDRLNIFGSNIEKAE
ncbi:MAG TPA: hypothetical protein ENJ95_15455 [Bacteroidetes bacterium]|nr:hypothetical protein [Bacteroidota bacterium]